MQITARFAREYLAATGRSVGFRLSFGGSGTQARPNAAHTMSLLAVIIHSPRNARWAAQHMRGHV